MKKIRSFKPITGKGPKILILGTMPGIKSLEKKQYYGHPNNSFWRILYSLFSGHAEPDADYRNRKKFVKENAVALWDVISECERPNNSSDSDIRDAEPNNVGSFLKRHKSIEAVFFNGAKAREYFNKYFTEAGFVQKFVQLPSTSPANTMKFRDKLKRWGVLKKHAKR